MGAHAFSILVVDDIPMMRLMLCKYVRTLGKKVLEPILGEMDLKVLEAGDGCQAAIILEESPVDLVFLDLMMPVKDGLTLLKEMRQETRLDDVKVIVCSAVSEQAIKDRAREIGATAYLVKPFSLDSIRKSLLDLYAPTKALKASPEPAETLAESE